MGRFKLVPVVAIGVLTSLFLATSIFACAGNSWCGTQSKNVEGLKVTTRAPGDSTAEEVQVEISSGFLTSYFQIRGLLAQDEVKGLDKLSKSLLGDTKKFRKTLKKGKAPAEQLDALKKIEKAASAMKTRELKPARESFKVLSRQVLAYVESYGCDGPAYSFYCPMAKESWLQRTDKTGNPYYGSAMFKCGKMTGFVKEGKYVKQEAAQKHEAGKGEHKHK